MSTSIEPEVRFRLHRHHHNHLALVAVSPRDGLSIGAARCIRHEHDDESADVEVSVDDAWQGKGIGIELVRQIVEHARSLGVRRIVMAIPAEAESAALTA